MKVMFLRFDAWFSKVTNDRNDVNDKLFGSLLPADDNVFYIFCFGVLEIL